MTHVILVLAQLAFASLSVLGRIAYDHLHLPPDAVVLVRMTFGLMVFALWARAQGSPLRVRRQDVALLVGCALLGTVLNQMLFLHGLAELPKATAATNASLLGATIPVFAAIFAVLFGRERFRLTRAVGIALALGGALTLIDFGKLTWGGGSLLGNVMVLANCMSYALFLVLVRPLSARYAPMQLVAMLFMVGLVTTAPFGVVAWTSHAPPVTWEMVGVLALIVIFPTVAAYALVQAGLRRAESSAVATYVYLQPVFATALAVLILGERPGPRVGLAAALIFIGVWISTRPVKATAPGGQPAAT